MRLNELADTTGLRLLTDRCIAYLATHGYGDLGTATDDDNALRWAVHDACEGQDPQVVAVALAEVINDHAKKHPEAVAKALMMLGVTLDVELVDREHRNTARST